ncbi:LPS assembly lipoprotein LptE [Desulfurella amilsii]|nr:LPS assembly lipoprotein LptE [Desulfurella amilsii]
MKLRFGFVFIILFFFLNSCGYQLSANHIYLPDHISAVYVENPKNSTYEPNISIYLKNAIINDLRLEPNLRIVSNKSDAQAFIKTDIVSFSALPASYNASGFASMYSCSIIIKLSLIAKDGKKLISEKTLTSSTNYSTPSNTNINNINSIESAKLEATKATISDLASLIREELFMSSGF